MSLQNLLKIRQLDEHTTDAAQVEKMLDSAERSIADAKENSIGLDTRFDAAEYLLQHVKAWLTHNAPELIA